METLTQDDRAPSAPQPRAELVVRRSGTGRMVSGGTDSWIVELGGRWVGWVGDGRQWNGSSFGETRWWACWRELDDEHPRWFLAGLRSQQEAVDALVACVQGGKR